MRKKNRLLAVAVVVTAVVAACLGVKLSTTDQAVISVPSAVNCGMTMVGVPISCPQIMVSPQTQTDDDYITSITANCAEFALQLAPPLPASPAHVFCDDGTGTGTADMSIAGEGYGTGACIARPYSFSATFLPAGPGTTSCPVYVNYTSAGGGSGQALITLSGAATAPMYSMTINPPDGATLDYGTIPTGTSSSSQRVTITNNGTDELTVTGTNSLPGTFELTPVAPATFANQTLGVGSAASYDVRCRPTATQLYSGTLSFTAQPGNITRMVNMSCTGITSALEITPNPASFERDVIVGGPPADITVTIKNSGAPTTLDDIHIDPVNASGEVTIVGVPPIGALNAGSSATVLLHYTAATEHAFGKIDSLFVGTTVGTDRSVTINAEALPGGIGTTPAVVDFGPVCAGGGPASQEVFVYTTAASKVTLESVTPPESPFEVTSPNGILQGNHNNMISITATVTPTAAGDLGSELVLNTNLPGTDSQRTVEMIATALPSGVTPTPALTHFGPGMVDALSVAKEITVSNCGTSAIDITSASIVGQDPGDFTIVSPADPAMALPQMGSVKFLVVMSPRTNGTKSARLKVDYEGGSVLADLDGNGFGGDSGSDTEMGTYYTCSAGGAGAGGVPIALALVFLRRRRQRASTLG